MKELTIKPAMGIGDQCYAPIIGKILNDTTGMPIKAVTTLPWLFEGFKNITPFIIDDMRERNRISGLDISYVPYKQRPFTTQWEDTLDAAQVLNSGVWKQSFKIPEKAAVSRKYNTTKKVCIIKPPIVVHFEKRFGTRHLTPAWEPYQKIIDAYKDVFYFVAIGGKDDEYVHELDGIDLDLRGKTTVRELFGAIKGADAVITQTGNAHIIGEGFGKKVFLIISSAGLKCDNKFLSSITLDKLRCVPTLTNGAMDTARDIVEKAGVWFAQYMGGV
jgi:hypothetical protein